MNKVLQITFCIGFSCFVTLPLSAAVLTEYTFASGTQTASNVASGLTAGNFAAAPGISGASTSYSNGWAQVGGDQLSGATAADLTLDAAITNGDYFSFTITPDSGYELNLTSLTMGVAAYRASSASSSVGATFYALSSIDGFTTSDLIDSIRTTQQNAPPAFEAFSVTLSGAAYQNLSTAVEFRIYMVMNTTSASRYAALDSVVLNGSLVAVPEPSTWTLLAVTGILGLMRRKPRH